MIIQNLMKKLSLFILPFFLLALLIPPAAPVYAAPLPDPATVDTSWVCGAGFGEGSCNDTSTMSPYIYNGSGTIFNNSGSFLTGAAIMCTGRPGCINDYDVYFRVTASYSWTSFPTGSEHVTTTTSVKARFASAYTQTDDCGTGTSGTCNVVFIGMIPAADLRDYSPYYWDVEASFASAADGGLTYFSSVTYSVYFSLLPYSEKCSENYLITDAAEYPIDPVLENPQGRFATPPDYQKWEDLIVDQIYVVQTKGGPWNDGTTDSYETAVSFDGIDYVPLTDVVSLCTEVDPIDPSLRMIFFTATTTEFYIRVNDTAGNFADNTATTPMVYSFGLAFENPTAPPCDSQFSYDPATDTVGSVTVHANVESTTAATDLVPEEWYGIEVASGTWSDNGGAPSTDMDFAQTATLYDGSDWQPLGSGSSGVWCVSETGTNIVYIQASTAYLYLRVADGDNNFSNNTGTLGVNIYHATFDRATSSCENLFSLGDMVGSDTVDAKAENGKVFALAYGNGDISLSTGLVPGGWYAIQTTGGPWGYQGAGHNQLAMSYEMAVSENGSTWTPLSDWATAECVAQTDALGHVLAYFHVPETGGIEYKIRVNDDAQWFSNNGYMGWTLYQAVGLENIPEPGGECDYTFDPGHKLFGGTVSAKSEGGDYIQTLARDSFYAVVVKGSTWYWQESAGGDHLGADDMQVSDDNGTNWHDLPDGYSGALCTMHNGQDLIFFIKTGTSMPEYKIRMDSTSFSNNEGSMGWEVYVASPGQAIDPWATCKDGNVLNLINSMSWITVWDPQGSVVNGVQANGSGQQVGGLVIGETYSIHIVQGPWYDGETNDQHYDAQLSSDNGGSWYDIGDRSDPGIYCAEEDQNKQGWWAIFTVKSGQLWRVRVADTDTAKFQDNTGNLAYELYGMSGEDVPGMPPGSIIPPSLENGTGTNSPASCDAPLTRPDGISTLSDILEIGGVISNWIDFARMAVTRFFAWCPQNTNTMLMLLAGFEKYEPFATMHELDTMLNGIRVEMASYDWTGEGQSESILTMPTAQFVGQMQTKVFGRLPDDSPWVNGDLIHFAPADSSIWEGECNTAFSEYIGPRLTPGVCFASSWARETGMSFWVQLTLDVSALFAAISMIWKSIKDVIAMLTGVAQISVMGK